MTIDSIPKDICSTSCFNNSALFCCPEQIPSISIPEIYPRKSPDLLIPVTNNGKCPPTSNGSTTYVKILDLHSYGFIYLS